MGLMTEQPLERDDTRAGTSTLERTEVRQLEEPGDRDRFSHYVRKDKIVASAVAGTPVVALCGKVWVPNRDPRRFPVCPACKEILDKAFGPDDGAGAGND
jgi:hypothetical protein